MTSGCLPGKAIFRGGTIGGGDILTQSGPQRLKNLYLHYPVPAALLKMDYGNPRWRPVMDLEGLKSWQPGRAHGYEELAAAIAFEDEFAARPAGAREK